MTVPYLCFLSFPIIKERKLSSRTLGTQTNGGSISTHALVIAVQTTHSPSPLLPWLKQSTRPYLRSSGQRNATLSCTWNGITKNLWAALGAPMPGRLLICTASFAPFLLGPHPDVAFCMSPLHSQAPSSQLFSNWKEIHTQSNIAFYQNHLCVCLNKYFSSTTKP